MKPADVDRPMSPQPGAPTWTVPIDMPVYQGGRSQGKPVGWLTSNDTYTTMNGNRHHALRRRLWREKAYSTYELVRLRREFNRVAAGRRVFLTFTYQFVNRTHPDLINLPDTEKPIIDALQPSKSYVREGKPMHRTIRPKPVRSEATQLAARAGYGLAFLGVLFTAVFAAGYAEINLMAGAGAVLAGAGAVLAGAWAVATSPITYLIAAVAVLLWARRGLFQTVQHG